MRAPAFPTPNVYCFDRQNRSIFRQIEPDVKHGRPLRCNIPLPTP